MTAVASTAPRSTQPRKRARRPRRRTPPIRLVGPVAEQAKHPVPPHRQRACRARYVGARTMSTDRLAAMEIFVRVVDAGSCSAAATQLGIGQPAVSKTVAQLEERLGVQLLVRTTRNLNLTDAGGRFYENAKRAIEGVNLAERVARGDGGITGTLRVSASICFSRVHVMPRLSAVFAPHPDVGNEIVVNDPF